MGVVGGVPVKRWHLESGEAIYLLGGACVAKPKLLLLLAMLKLASNIALFGWPRTNGDKGWPEHLGRRHRVHHGHVDTRLAGDVLKPRLFSIRSTLHLDQVILLSQHPSDIAHLGVIVDCVLHRAVVDFVDFEQLLSDNL